MPTLPGPQRRVPDGSGEGGDVWWTLRVYVCNLLLLGYWFLGLVVAKWTLGVHGGGGEGCGRARRFAGENRLGERRLGESWLGR